MMLEIGSTFNRDFCKRFLRRKKEFSPASPKFDVKSAFDVNLNNDNISSPGHCSSQDGSFIQDDDMRLILEFGGLLVDGKSSAVATAAAVTTAKAATLLPAAAAATSMTSSSLFTSSRIRRRRVERRAARCFDADIVAHLDFDDFSASRDMAPLYDVNRCRVDDSVFGSTGDDLFSGSVFAGDLDFARPNNKSSDDVIALETSPKPFPVKAPPAPAAFISTDSLNTSCCMSLTEEHWQNFCAPNKREYVLTFDKQAFESGLAAFSTILDSYCSYDEENFGGKNSYSDTQYVDLNDIHLSADQFENADVASKINLHIGDKKLDFCDDVKLGSVKCHNSIIAETNQYLGNGIEDNMKIRAENNKMRAKRSRRQNEADDNHNENINFIAAIDKAEKRAHAVDENFNDKRFIEEPTDENLPRIRNESENNVGENEASVEPIKLDNFFGEKPTCYSEQTLLNNTHNDNNSSTTEDNTVTWQRIKRSYDQAAEAPNFSSNSKCVSLPNLKPYAKPNIGENASEEQTPKLAENNSLPSGGGGDCLLKAFQQQRQLKEQNPFLLLHRRISNQSESGYQTGNGSSNVGNYFPANQFDPDLTNKNDTIDTYTTLDQCQQLLRMDFGRKGVSDQYLSDYYPNGKGIDANHNEIDNLSAYENRIYWKTDQKRHSDTSLIKNCAPRAVTDPEFLITDQPLPPAKPPRTFRAFSLETANSPDKSARYVLNRSAQTAEDLTGSISISIPSKSLIDQSPDLSFLRFPFAVPPLNISVTPFLRNFINDNSGVGVGAQAASTTSSLNDEDDYDDVSPRSTNQILTKAPNRPRLIDSKNRAKFADQSASSCEKSAANNGVRGPDHVQDWDSLATLLPENVVKCCRFFAEQRNTPNGCSPPTKFDFVRNIDKPSRTKLINNRRKAFGSSLHCNYDGGRFDRIDETDDDGDRDVCGTVSPTVDRRRFSGKEAMALSDGYFFTQNKQCCGMEPCGDQCSLRRIPKSYPAQHCCPCCRVQNLEPNNVADRRRYKISARRDQRRFTVIQVSDLIECKVFESKVESLTSLTQKITVYCSRIDVIFKQSAFKDADDPSQCLRIELGSLIFNSLCPSIEALITDELSPGKTLCDLLKLSPAEDIATKSICGWLINGLDVSGGARERSLQFAIFVDSLLSSKSLSLWLSNLISNERVLYTHYSKFGYLRLLATKTCVNLYESVFDALKLLTRLPFHRLQLIDMDLEAEIVEKCVATTNAYEICGKIKEAESTKSIRSISPSLATPTDQSPTNFTQSRLKSPRVYCSPPACFNQQQSSVDAQNLIMVQDELRIIFKFPATLTNRPIICGRSALVKDEVVQRDSKTSMFRFSPAQLANDSRIPKNSSSILLRLNSPKKTSKSSPTESSTPKIAINRNSSYATNVANNATPSADIACENSARTSDVLMSNRIPNNLLNTDRRLCEQLMCNGVNGSEKVKMSPLDNTQKEHDVSVPSMDRKPVEDNALGRFLTHGAKEKTSSIPVRSNAAPKSRIPLLSRIGAAKANANSIVPSQRVC